MAYSNTQNLIGSMSVGLPQSCGRLRETGCRLTYALGGVISKQNAFVLASRFRYHRHFQHASPEPGPTAPAQAASNASPLADCEIDDSEEHLLKYFHSGLPMTASHPWVLPPLRILLRVNSS